MPQPAFRIYGNTYYVGTHGLGSILIASQAGHVLIDGALPGSVPQIVANIKSLGFRVEDFKLSRRFSDPSANFCQSCHDCRKNCTMGSSCNHT
jgi:hypothetical protein